MELTRHVTWSGGYADAVCNVRKNGGCFIEAATSSLFKTWILRGDNIHPSAKYIICSACIQSGKNLGDPTEYFEEEERYREENFVWDGGEE